MKSITMKGKTVEEAIELALAELNATRDEVEIKVLDEGSKGVLGLFGKKLATIKMFPKFDSVSTVMEIISDYLKNMDINCEIDIKKDSESHVLVNLPSDDCGFLIGKHGSTLDAFETIVNLAVNRKSPYHMYITINIGTYLETRKETLERLALNVASKVKQTKQKYIFEPMKASERKIIHTVLQDMKNIKTLSIGEEPERKVVIEYADN